MIAGTVFCRIYSSSNLVIFVNYEDFLNEIKVLDNSKIAKKPLFFLAMIATQWRTTVLLVFLRVLLKKLMNLKT